MSLQLEKTLSPHGLHVYMRRSDGSCERGRPRGFGGLFKAPGREERRALGAGDERLGRGYGSQGGDTL